MKKFMMICVAALSMFLVACGGGNKTADAQISAYEAAIKKLETAKASDVEAISNELAKAMADSAANADTSAVTEAQAKKINELATKYAELMQAAMSKQ